MILNNLISYYNSCYQSDNRALTLDNFFSNKIEDRIIVEGKEEILNGFLPHKPLDNELAEKIKKTISLYKKEKELIYCSLFIIGKRENFRKKITKIAAPLFIYPAEIVHENELYYIKIDKEKRRINYSILNHIHEDDKNNSQFFEELHNVIGNSDIDLVMISEITKVLNKYVDNIVTDQLFTYPELYSKKHINKLLQPKKLDENVFKIIPASGIGIMKKSTNTRGIINELTEISKAEKHSQPLQAVFGFGNFEPNKTSEIGKVPAILNNAQKKVLENASKHPFSLIVGPPGTGKTYTISALAIEQMSKGKSVLIASRTDQAVDVIAEKIETQLNIDGIIIRAGKSSYLRNLKKYLTNILSGYKKIDNEKTSKKIAKEIDKIQKKIAKLERKFENRVGEEDKWGDFFANNLETKNPIKKIRKKYIGWKNNISETHWELIKQLENELDNLNEQTKNYIEGKYSEQIDRTLQNGRNELNTFLKALRARRGARKEDLFNETNFEVILKTFPIWLVKMSDIHNVLPLAAEMFDIAIIDEATQCDIASTIPIIQRAKFAVFTGDPNQLRHISFLSRSKQNILKEKYGLHEISPEMLNYRDNSILDIISDNIENQQQVSFLNEHYRCLPAIIRFSNKNIYSSALKIMTSKPNIPINEGVELLNCNGTRDNQGINEAEAEKIISKVVDIIHNEESFIQPNCTSVGILSPFRNQVDYISDKIKETLSIEQIEKHNIAVGTAYNFQGEERDTMLLSFVVDNNSHSMAFRHINKQAVFNVAITRGRTMQYIYHSLDIMQLKTDSLLRKYLEDFNKESIEKSDYKKDIFAKEVKQELKKQGFKVWIGFVVAGLDIDIIFQKGEITYGIDLIGFPGDFKEAFSLERYKMLNRAGLKIFPLPFTYWQVDKDNCMNELKQFL